MSDPEACIRRQKADAELYVNIMDEIRTRVGALHTATTDEFANSFEGPIAGEFCILQLHKICECIALACLAAHGDLKIARAEMREEYRAERIIKRLDKLHAAFYPQPFTILSETEGAVKVADIRSGYLTKAQLLRLYNTAHVELHCGNLLNRPRSSGRFTTGPFMAWIERIERLLGNHRIQLIDPNEQFWITMNDPATGHVRLQKRERNPRV